MKYKREIATITSFLLAVREAVAQQQPPFSLENPLGNRTVTEVLEGLADTLLDLSIPAVAILVTIGALQMLFSGGNPEKFMKGRKTLLYTVVGFAIVLVARGVAALVRELLS